MLFKDIQTTINRLNTDSISKERKAILNQLIAYIQQKASTKQRINLNFICTHNSRRSHLSQVWAQTLAYHFGIDNLYCYSGGTEATALFPMAAKTMSNSGFKIETLSESSNPIYSIKYADNVHPIVGFSKTFDASFNPKTSFAAVMTCASADENCPFVLGAEKRIALTFEDPKAYDGTPQQNEKYLERSIQIATELKYVLSNIKQNG